MKEYAVSVIAYKKTTNTISVMECSVFADNKKDAFSVARNNVLLQNPTLTVFDDIGFIPNLKKFPREQSIRNGNDKYCYWGYDDIVETIIELKGDSEETNKLIMMLHAQVINDFIAELRKDILNL